MDRGGSSRLSCLTFSADLRTWHRVSCLPTHEGMWNMVARHCQPSTARRLTEAAIVFQLSSPGGTLPGWTVTCRFLLGDVGPHKEGTFFEGCCEGQMRWMVHIESVAQCLPTGASPQNSNCQYFSLQIFGKQPPKIQAYHLIDMFHKWLYLLQNDVYYLRGDTQKPLNFMFTWGMLHEIPIEPTSLSH